VTAVNMVRLRDLGDWTGGNTPSKANPAYWTSGTIPWVSPKDMKTDAISSSEDHVTQAALKEGRVSLLPEGSVLFVTRSGILSHTFPVAVTKVAVTINQDLKALTPRHGVLADYVAHAVRGASRRVLKQCSKNGTTVASIETNALLDFEIPLVDIDAQRRIVAEIEKQFSRLDEAIATIKRAKANLKRYRSSILHSVTNGALKPDGGLTPSASDWRWLTVVELASSEPRSIQSGPFGSNLRHSEFQTTGKLVIGIDNVRDGEFSLGSNNRISDRKFRELARYAARPRDVLITVMATVGRVCVLPAEIEESIITKHVYRITVDKNIAIPEYIGIALRGSGEVRKQLMSSVQGQTRPGLNGGLIKKIRVPVPPLAQQALIVAEVDRRLSLVHALEAEVEANMNRAQALRLAVLGRAFGA
jgi:type I restriction enzyme, S subunit